MLGEINPLSGLQLVVELLEEELSLFQLDKQIDDQVRKRVELIHKELYRQQKLKVIQAELRVEDRQRKYLEKQMEAVEKELHTIHQKLNLTKPDESKQ